VSGSDRNHEPCTEELRELVAWASAGDLTAEESRRVREHVAACPECARRLEVADWVATATRAAVRPHPAPETIVAWVEDRASMSTPTRAWIEAHLASCEACADEVRGLERVESGVAARPPFLVRLRAGLALWMRGPVPAFAAVAAALLVGVWLGRDGSGLGLPGEPFAQTPTILGDARGVWRGSEDEAPPPIVDRNSPLLLLELTELEAPPVPGDVWVVRIGRAPATPGSPPPPPTWETRVDGGALAAEYTLVLRPPAAALGAGDHVVRVIGPDGEVAFEATFFVR
jgi:hypothetical protein